MLIDGKASAMALDKNDRVGRGDPKFRSSDILDPKITLL